VAASIVYTPTATAVTQDEDNLVWHTANQISSSLGLGGNVRHNGTGNLNELQADGGVLYVVGHGNAGKGIGAHGHAAIGATALVAQLTQQGLPTRPARTITVHLYACATGASVRTDYALWRKDPYAQRFAKHLASAGFNDYYVVGYVGFMSPFGQHSVHYHLQDADQRIWEGQSKEDAPRVKYYVNAGGYAKVEGETWQQCTEVRVHPLERRTSVVLHIRRA
jgi:hypothetical protein